VPFPQKSLMFFEVAHGRPWKEEGQVADSEDGHHRNSQSDFSDMESDTALVVPKEAELDALP